MANTNASRGSNRGPADCVCRWCRHKGWSFSMRDNDGFWECKSVDKCTERLVTKYKHPMGKWYTNTPEKLHFGYLHKKKEEVSDA